MKTKETSKRLLVIYVFGRNRYFMNSSI